MGRLSEQQMMNHLAERLAASFPVGLAQISRIVGEEHARFDGRPIRDFVPLFVERSARTKLARLSAAGDVGHRDTVVWRVELSVDLPNVRLDTSDVAPDAA